jgi:hypothetical protein
MIKLLTAFVGLILTVCIGGSIYDMTRHMAASAKHAYQFDQISYAKFTKAMTEAKPRRPQTK